MTPSHRRWWRRLGRVLAYLAAWATAATVARAVGTFVHVRLTPTTWAPGVVVSAVVGYVLGCLLGSLVGEHGDDLWRWCLGHVHHLRRRGQP